MSRGRPPLRIVQGPLPTLEDRRAWAGYLRASADYNDTGSRAVTISPQFARRIAQALWPEAASPLTNETYPSDAAKFAVSDPNIFPGITE